MSKLQKNEKGEMVKTVISPLKKGDYFGESALLRDTKRMATVSATSNLECLCLNQELFLKLFDGKRFKVQFAKRNAVSAEKNQDSNVVINNDLFRDKSDAIRKLISDTISSNVLFKNLDAEQMHDIVSTMHRVEIKSGTELIKQGAVADNFYVVESGEFHVFVARDGGAPQVYL